MGTNYRYFDKVNNTSSRTDFSYDNYDLKGSSLLYIGLVEK